MRCRNRTDCSAMSRPVELLSCASMPSPLGYPSILFSPLYQAGGNLQADQKCVNVQSCWSAQRPACLEIAPQRQALGGDFSGQKEARKFYAGCAEALFHVMDAILGQAEYFCENLVKFRAD